jgi:antitoxin (DNA-binding transcriptional repressor) of toxin-antitoxin stability system
MKTVTMLDFRRHADAIIRKVRQGQSLILTYRGQRVLRLEPMEEASIPEDDPFYTLPRSAEPGGKPLTNAQIDRIVYGRKHLR